MERMIKASNSQDFSVRTSLHSKIIEDLRELLFILVIAIDICNIRNENYV